ncbi:MAG TPA: carboxymuconolactone decarboxylase family protein [Candidatus Sulfomarinibacteraceae bacterium]|nr:carboxymuconolactone decarboxylase family protein [Candidatus Sulfomarinibacteraceae bacterium]
MADADIPRHYRSLKERFPEVMGAVETLGGTVRRQGSLNGRTAHLVQLAAAAAIGSEGAVHSHARRALEEGAEPEEIYHTVLLLISTIGFPRAAAAISWVDDIVGG